MSSSLDNKRKISFYINSDEINEFITINYSDVTVPTANGTLNITRVCNLLNPKNNKSVGKLYMYSNVTPNDSADLTKGGVIETKMVFNLLDCNYTETPVYQITTYGSNVTSVMSDLSSTSLSALSGQNIIGFLELNSNPKLKKAKGKFKMSIPASTYGTYKILGTVILKE